ncbi:MAG: SDR family oxidoreductase [Candidatus Paceibacterota bacterium]|jgi:NAD(P)-dependent dehydrogenase (short-subunit alcohol dehydrogenase family)
MTEQQKSIAIVTGGSGYLGSAIVANLTRRGWRVVTLSRTAIPGSIVCDITDPRAVHAAIDTIIKTEKGTLRACIHAAAAPLERKEIMSISFKSFATTVDTTLTGAFLFATEAVPHMVPGSVFIGITTQAIEPNVSYASLGAYVIAKQALRSLLRLLSIELVPKHIRVYAVAPGFLPGGLNRDMPQAVLDLLASKQDVNASLEHAAKLIADLCSEPEQYPGGFSIAMPSQTATPL